MLVNRVHVSSGNRKLGKTPNVSLLPVVTCPQGVPCAKECYARGLMYSLTATKAWMNNTALAMNDPVEFAAQVRKWLDTHATPFFRWHVSGDVPSAEYKEWMCRIADDFPETSFMVFTKNMGYWWPRKKNLKVTFSFWPGDGYDRNLVFKNTNIRSFAWVEGDKRAPEDGLKCSGLCGSCRACWNKDVMDVVLKKH